MWRDPRCGSYIWILSMNHRYVDPSEIKGRSGPRCGTQGRLQRPFCVLTPPNPNLSLHNSPWYSLIPPSHSVTLLQAHYPFPDSLPKLMAVYAYLLSHPGIPCVFWQHVYGKKNGAGIVNGEEEGGG